ncbi:MAG: hypothetical protein FWB85_02495 [Chitinispirillia bacterium]|nr:hypothetical protein [Chitinispirillia bacterium]MCL2241253.1 hypothetical protein [Chitinispirillia bacterium]
MRTAAAIILACVLFAPPARAQSQNQSPSGKFYGPAGATAYSIADRHFRGVLFPEAYKSLPGTRICYPGLWVPERAAAAFAYLPDAPGANTAGLNGLYGWADIDIHPGSAGLWAGDFDYGDGYRVSEYADVVYSWDTHEFSLRGAMWVTPFNGERLRGFSAAVDIDNAYAYNGNEYDGLTEIRHVFLNINVLTKISENYNLRFTLSVNNRHSESPEDTRSDNRRLFTDALSLTLVDDKLRTLELRAQNSFAMNYADEKSDTVAVSLHFTQGRVWSYMTHALFAGVMAEGGAHIPSRINDNAGSFQYMYYLQNLTAKGRTVRTSLALPIILDAGLIRGIRAMLSICPKAAYYHTSPPDNPGQSPLYNAPQHRFYLYLPPAELSFRGTVGEKIDFALMPSLTSSVLISALEIRYRF